MSTTSADTLAEWLQEYAVGNVDPGSHLASGNGNARRECPLRDENSS
jgi:hypothetical protein